MSTDEQIFADIVIFLRDTLKAEELSPNVNQRRLALLQKILCRESPVLLPYIDMSGSHKSIGYVDSTAEYYEELESTWSDSAASSASRTYSNTLPSTNKNQRFSFFFGNGLGDSKSKELNKGSTDTTDFSNDTSKRNSVLSDSDNSVSRSSVKSEDSLEVTSISASAIKYSAVKCGMLVRKEKTLCFEYSKRLWVALLGTTLYIYNNEKDAKPIDSINVDDYNARPIVAAQTNKKEFGFEIVCPGKKTYQFFSTTKTEMEAWVLSVNHSLPLPQISTETPTLRPAAQVTADSLDSKLSEYSKKRNRTSCRYGSGDNRADRELPSLPVYLHYDIPNPACRAVIPEGTVNRLSSNSSNEFQETFYHSIDDELIAEQLARYDFPVRRDPVLKENTDRQNYNPGDALYYNLLDHIRVIETSENNSPSNDHKRNTSISNGEEKENVCNKNGFSRIRLIIQRMEEINNQNKSYNKRINSLENESKLSNSRSSTKTDEVYELVNSPTYVNT